MYHGEQMSIEEIRELQKATKQTNAYAEETERIRKEKAAQIELQDALSRIPTIVEHLLQDIIGIVKDPDGKSFIVERFGTSSIDFAVRRGISNEFLSRGFKTELSSETAVRGDDYDFPAQLLLTIRW